jgi:hypothetical protein
MAGHPPPFTIASVNMRKRNAVTHALLNCADTNTQLILIQEPWFDTIGTARKDTAREGVDVLGGVASPEWEILYPGLLEGQRAKVMAYARKRAQDAHNTPNFTVIPRLDVTNHPCLQVLDIIFDNEQWRVINVYHDTQDKSVLPTLLAIDVDAVTPTLVTGDFNTHSPSWSPPDIPRSSWAGRVEEWAAANLLTLANVPGEITRKGADHERDSVIDLAWYNEAAIQKGTFSGLTLDWEGSLGSDHALLSISGKLHDTRARPAKKPDLGLVIEPERKEEWLRAFKSQPAPNPLPFSPTPEEVEKAANALTKAIQHASQRVFRKRRPFHPKGSPWWNTACALAAQNLREAQGTEAKKTAQARLKGAVRTAKREWADEYIASAQLWDVAAWRHGRRASKVPSLRGPDGLAHSHEEISDILSRRFFADAPPPGCAPFPRRPPTEANARAPTSQ